jgi:hypothetical protein
MRLDFSSFFRRSLASRVNGVGNLPKTPLAHKLTTARGQLLGQKKQSVLMLFIAPIVDGKMTKTGSVPPQQQLGHQQQQQQLRQVKHKRRYCRYPSCTRIVKSQGLCQRHGAKPRSCRVEGCTKQAQGNFDGMCSK